MLTILAFFALISIVVSVHEYGHYLAARYSGVKVLVFSIGFGKPLFACRFRGTIWQVCMVPLGGYIKMLSQKDPLCEDLCPATSALETQPAYKKMLIDLAGPMANFVFASIIFMFVFLQGIEVSRPVIGQVVPDSYADKMGIQSEMQVLAVNGQMIDSWETLQSVFNELLAERGRAQITLQNPRGIEDKKQLDLAMVKAKEADMLFFMELGLSPFPLTTQVEAIKDKSAAQQAGLRVGDEIIAMGGEPISDWETLWRKIRLSSDKSVQLTVLRQGKKETMMIRPESTRENDQTYGTIGIVPKIDEKRLKAWRTTRHYSLLESMVAGVQRTWEVGKNIVNTVWGMLMGRVPLKQLSGPIYIAQIAGSSIQAGWRIFIQSLALLSMSLGVLNLLPIPILDGGRLLYHSAEWVRGKPLSDNAFILGQRLSIVIIFLIMTLALFNDLSRL